MTLSFVTKLEVGKLILERFKSISNNNYSPEAPPLRKKIIDAYGNGDPLRLILLELYDTENQFPIMVVRDGVKYFVTRDINKVKNKETKSYNGEQCRYLYLPDTDPIMLTDNEGNVSYRYFLDECKINPCTLLEIVTNFLKEYENQKNVMYNI